MKINYQFICIALILCVAFLLFNRGGSESGSVNTQEAVINNIMTRTSVRNYTKEPVSDEQLETLVKAAMAAPTAANMQPWEFVVITDKFVMEKYAVINKYATMAKTAPAAIAVIGNLNAYASRSNMSGYWAQDCSAATENLLLAAHAMGLGAVWTGVYSENTEYASARMKGTSKLLNLPPNKIPLALIFIGHPEGETMPKDKWKPEKVTWMK